MSHCVDAALYLQKSPVSQIAAILRITRCIVGCALCIVGPLGDKWFYRFFFFFLSTKNGWSGADRCAVCMWSNDQR